MILELADIRIVSGRQAEFDEAIQRGVTTVVSKAKGFRGWQVQKGIESPERYVLLIAWDTLEDHTVGFRQSDRFVQWRAIVAPFFAEAPKVEHSSGWEGRTRRSSASDSADIMARHRPVARRCRAAKTRGIASDQGVLRCPRPTPLLRSRWPPCSLCPRRTAPTA
jgi:heme-degrading monooxygenase HmoA